MPSPAAALRTAGIWRSRALLAMLVLVANCGEPGVGPVSGRTASGPRQRACCALRFAAGVIDTYFRGELATLGSIAGSPPVVGSDVPAMQRYFERLQPRHNRAFSAGLAWIDSKGFARASTVGRAAAPYVNLADRSYFWNVMGTGKPYVSEAITSRLTHGRVIVMAVPTRTARGRLTGVLVGALTLRPFGIASGALDLQAGPGVAVLDRAGHSLEIGLAIRRNPAPARGLHGTGVIADTRGLDGSAGHALAYSTSAIPGWTIVIDRAALLALRQRPPGVLPRARADRRGGFDSCSS